MDLKNKFEELYKGKLDLTLDSSLPINYVNNKTNYAWCSFVEGFKLLEKELLKEREAIDKIHEWYDLHRRDDGEVAFHICEEVQQRRLKRNKMQE